MKALKIEMIQDLVEIIIRRLGDNPVLENISCPM